MPRGTTPWRRCRPVRRATGARAPRRAARPRRVGGVPPGRLPAPGRERPRTADPRLPPGSAVESGGDAAAPPPGLGAGQRAARPARAVPRVRRPHPLQLAEPVGRGAAGRDHAAAGADGRQQGGAHLPPDPGRDACRRCARRQDQHPHRGGRPCGGQCPARGPAGRGGGDDDRPDPAVAAEDRPQPGGADARGPGRLGEDRRPAGGPDPDRRARAQRHVLAALPRARRPVRPQALRLGAGARDHEAARDLPAALAAVRERGVGDPAARVRPAER